MFAVPDLFITSPSSWSALRRIKDTLNRYILSPDPSQGQVNSLWGVPVVTTTAVTPGDGFLLDTTLFGLSSCVRVWLSAKGCHRMTSSVSWCVSSVKRD